MKDMKPTSGMRHEQYVARQIERDSEFAAVYDEARLEARLALALADLREQRALSQRDLDEATGIKGKLALSHVYPLDE